MANIRTSLLLSFLDKYSAMAVGIIANLVLARLLTPYDIGLFSIAVSAVGLASALRDFGIGSYLVSEKELTVARQRSAMGVAMVITWTIGGALALASGYAADVYHDPGVKDVILALSINFFFIPLTMVVIMVLRREMRFGVLYRMGLVAAVTRAAIGIGLASFGFGFMSLAWSSVAGSVAIFVMVHIELPQAARLLPSFREWRRITSFGIKSTAGQILGEVGQAAPNMLIGRILSPVAVGFYSRATGVVSLFSQSILEGLSPVAVSALAMHHRQGGDVGAFMVRGLTHITALGWPFFTFVALLTFPVIRILFGDQWDAAVPLARLVCIAVIIGLLDSMTWAALQGTGSVGKYAVIQAFTVPFGIAVLASALIYGGSIEAAGYAAMINATVHVTASLTVIRRLMGLPIRDLARGVAKSAGIAILSNIIPGIVVMTMTIDTEHLWLPLIVAGCGAGVSFVAATFVLRHPLADEIIELLGTGMRLLARS